MIDNYLNKGRVLLLPVNLHGTEMTVPNTQVDALGEVGEHSNLGENERFMAAESWNLSPCWLCSLKS